jgi:5-methylthioadenosine/S-adenosylhomocysteine deaminase
MLIRGTVITMNPAGDVLADGCVAVDGDVITMVGRFADLRAAAPAATVVGDGSGVVTPGYVNAHQHVTGDRLIHSCIPETITAEEAIFGWAVPVHALHTADDEELSATLAAVDALTNGVTCIVEAGTVAHPLRVAAGLRRTGIRARVGQWGSDTPGLPGAADAAEVVARQRETLAALGTTGVVHGGITLVGHDLMSDELAVAAGELALETGAGLTFHMSPHGRDAIRYLARTGRWPLVHLRELGVLGEHVLVAHALHVDLAELVALAETRTAVAACPWAYLRLAQGLVRNGRHGELLRRGGRIALGCDAENAGNAVDVLRAAALFAGIERDRAEDPMSFTATTALELATRRGAEAIGLGDVTGSLETGKQADVVVHDTSGPAWWPPSTDPVQQLVWSAGARSVADVFVAGRHVIAGGRHTSIDTAPLVAEARRRRDALLAGRGRSDR